MSAKANTAAALAPLPPDVFELLVSALAGALLDDLRADDEAATVEAPRGVDRELENTRQTLALPKRNGERAKR